MALVKAPNVTDYKGDKVFSDKYKIITENHEKVYGGYCNVSFDDQISQFK